MVIKKFAVAPVHPSAVGLEPIAAPMIPTNWQDAFARLTDSVTTVVIAQAKKVADLTQSLADANGLIAALTKKQADDAGRLEKAIVGCNIAGIREEARDLRADLIDMDGKVTALIKGRAEIVANVHATDKRIDSLPSVHDSIAKVGEIITAGYEQSIKLITDAAAEKVTALTDLAGEARALVEQIGGKVDTNALAIRDLTETHAATRRQIDALASDVNDIGEDLGGRVAALTKGHSDLTAAGSENAAAVLKLAGGVAEDVERIDRNLATIEERVEAEQVRRVDSIDAVKMLVEDYASTASGEDAALADKIEKLDGHVTAAREVADNAKAHAGQAMGCYNDLAGTMNETVAQLGTLKTGVQDQFDGFADSLAGALQVSGDVRGLATGVHDRVEGLAGVVDALNKARADEAEVIEAIGRGVTGLKNTTDELSAQLGEISMMATDDSKRIEQVEEAVIGFVATTKNISLEVDGLGKLVRTSSEAAGEVSNEVTELNRRVTIALGQMTSAMMIDQDGTLKRVIQTGEIIDLGKVVSHGIDAPVLVAAKMEGDRLIMTMSDKSEIGCTVVRSTVEPAPVITGPDAIDPLTLGALSKDPGLLAKQVEHMAEMRAAGKKYKAIAEKFGTSEKTAAKLIRGFQNAQSKIDAAPVHRRTR